MAAAHTIALEDSCLAEYFEADPRRPLTRTADQLPAVHIPRTINPWDADGMDTALAAHKAAGARRCAALADTRIAAGAPHIDVLGALGAAEEHAVGTAAHAWHTARTDEYAARHGGLKGWRRDHQGRVYVHQIRTAVDGAKGRYYTHRPAKGDQCWVVDRDTGRTAHRAPTPLLAQAWINDRETARHTNPHTRLAAAGLRRGYHLTA